MLALHQIVANACDVDRMHIRERGCWFEFSTRCTGESATLTAHVVVANIAIAQMIATITATFTPM